MADGVTARTVALEAFADVTRDPNVMARWVFVTSKDIDRPLFDSVHAP